VAFGALLACVTNGCSTAGVSTVYMANDSGGLQHRQVFYTDSNAIYCITKFSSGRPDATLDFTIFQKSTYPWCGGATPSAVPNAPVVDETTGIKGPPIFAVGEQVPGVGVETVVGAEIEPNGITVNINCSGYCMQNVAASHQSLCSSVPTASVSCRNTFVSEGADSCGPGLTCCETTVATTAPPTGVQLASVPYPAGEYTCQVALDGVVVGSSDFSILYPVPGCPVPPPITGVPCYDWFPKGSQCPSYEAGETCTCEDSGAWDCVAP